MQENKPKYSIGQEVILNTRQAFTMDGHGVCLITEGASVIVSDVTVAFGRILYEVRFENATSVVEEHEISIENANLILNWQGMKDNKIPVEGYYIQGTPRKAEHDYNASELNCLYYTKTQAKSSLAMAKISQIIELPIYGGWVPYGKEAYYITFDWIGDDEPHLDCSARSKYNGGILRFRSQDIAELFLDNNTDLVKEYLMWQQEKSAATSKKK